MNAKDILLDLLDNFTGLTEWIIKDLAIEDLVWQPDSEANNVGVTMWHINRSFDLLKVQVMENRPIKPRISPFLTSKDTSSSTSCDPYFLLMFLRLMDILSYDGSNIINLIR